MPASRVEIADSERLPWKLGKIPPQPYMNEIYLQRYTIDTPAFFRDSLVQYAARTYYLKRDNSDGSKSQAWATGGWLAIRSGLIGDVFGVHLAAYTSQPIYAPSGQGGTNLLAPPQQFIGVLEQVYGRIQIGDQEFRAGRQLVDTPLINPSDNRMAPNTFEGATVVSLPDKDRLYDYSFGYLWTMKRKDSNDFISMSDVASGNDASNHGAAFGMLKVRPISRLSLVAMDYIVQNTLNTAFTQAEFNTSQPKEVPNWVVGANLINQQSIGSDQLTGSPFATYQASATGQMLYAGWTLFVAGSITGDSSAIYSPYGSKPNYTDMQQVSFDSAGERALGGSAAYDFTSVGLSGFSAGAWYTKGWGAITSGGDLGIPDRSELDVWTQYRPSQGPMKGFRLKAQYSELWQQGNVRPTQPEFRFVVDYTVLFRCTPIRRDWS